MTHRKPVMLWRPLSQGHSFMNLANLFLTPLLLNTFLVTALEGSLTLQLSFGIYLEDFSGWVAFPRV